ncbi:unnamed protein product [Effrenium voratum]|nr:unnamed protein product [Effrenium voratum]
MPNMEKTIVVRLEKTHKTNLGMHVDGLSLAVCLVEGRGLVAEWNAAFPSCAVEPGDRVVSVNGAQHPELVMEQLAAESVLQLVVAKQGALAAALAPQAQYSVQLRREESDTFGLEVNPDTAEVVQVLDDGRAAVWNAWHPFRALAVGDRIVEINGVHVGRHRLLETELDVDLVVLRGSGAAFGTFGVSFARVDEKLGFGLNKAMEVERMEGGGVAQLWNAANPINKLRLGDRILQANRKTGAAAMLGEMKSAGAKAGGAALGLVVARAERRFDAENQRFFSLKECQAEWPKDSQKRWGAMSSVQPEAAGPAGAAGATGSTFILELRHEGQGPGFDLDARKIAKVHDGGVLAAWNRQRPAQAAMVGDQVLEVNGFAGQKALEELKKSKTVRLTLLRQNAMSTFGVTFQRQAKEKLGFKTNEQLELARVEAEGLVPAWNAGNRLHQLHLGDRILQVGEVASAAEIFQRLQKAPELELVLARCPRRLDASGAVLTFRECQAAFGADAAARWAAMGPVPEAPAPPPKAPAPKEPAQFLRNTGNDDRPMLANESFYRSLADVRPSPGGGLRRGNAPALPAPPAPPAEAKPRSSFSCPCCNHLFHVFVEDGAYHTQPVSGALAGVRLQPQRDWVFKAFGRVFGATLSKRGKEDLVIDPGSLVLQSLKDAGAVAKWNQQQPAAAVVVGDLVLEVNSKPAHQALQELQAPEPDLQLLLARPLGGATFAVEPQVGKKGLDWQLSQNLVLITSPASDASADSDKAPELPWPVQGDKVVQVNQRLEAAAPLFWCPV